MLTGDEQDPPDRRDETVLRESLAELLAEEGHVVKQAENG